MVNQFVITKRLNGTEECVQYFQRSTRVFRERWLRKKNFASEKHAYERSKPRAATKLTRDFGIFFNIRWSHKVFYCEKSYAGGHLKAILAGKGGGGILNEPISCYLIEASESKYSRDSFILSFIEGSSTIIDVCKNSKIPYISWHDRFVETVFCFTLRNIFAKRDA